MKGNKPQVDCYQRNWAESSCSKLCMFFDDCYWESKKEEEWRKAEDLKEEIRELEKRLERIKKG